MYVTETSIGGHNMTPEAARDEMMARRNEGNGFNAIEQLRLVAGLCNSGEFDAGTERLPLHERKINGDATDQAILRLSESLGPIGELRRMWKKTFELAFNSKNKYMIRTFQLVEPEGLNMAFHANEAGDYMPGDR